jgi:hypothetical protein
LSLVVEIVAWLVAGQELSWFANWNDPEEFGAFGLLIGVPALLLGWALDAAIDD